MELEKECVELRVRGGFVYYVGGRIPGAPDAVA